MVGVRGRQIASGVQRANVGQQRVELSARDLFDEARVPQGECIGTDETLRTGRGGGASEWGKGGVKARTRGRG